MTKKKLSDQENVYKDSFVGIIVKLLGKLDKVNY